MIPIGNLRKLEIPFKIYSRAKSLWLTLIFYFSMYCLLLKNNAAHNLNTNTKPTFCDVEKKLLRVFSLRLTLSSLPLYMKYSRVSDLWH